MGLVGHDISQNVADDLSRRGRLVADRLIGLDARQRRRQVELREDHGRALIDGGHEQLLAAGVLAAAAEELAGRELEGDAVGEVGPAVEEALREHVIGRQRGQLAERRFALRLAIRLCLRRGVPSKYQRSLIRHVLLQVFSCPPPTIC